MVTLWPHQERIVSFMRGREYGLIHAGMGSGKTLAALEFIRREKLDRVLVVTKKKVVPVWEGEADKFGFTQNGMYVWGGDAKWSVKRFADELEDLLRIQADNRNFQFVVVVNYDRVWREPLFSLLERAGFDAIICDESHKIKSHNGQASNALFSLGRRVGRRFAMTGTPFPNGPMDAYGQLRFLEPKLVKVDPKRTGFTVYREFYCFLKPVRGAAPGVFEIDGYRNMDQFNAILQSVTLRIRTEDVLDLPEAIHIKRPVWLSSKAMKLYKELKKEAIAEVQSGVITVSNVLVKSMRLHQITGGFVKADKAEQYDFVDGEKIDALLDIIEDLEPGEPVVVAAKYSAEIKFIRRELLNKGYTVSVLSGNEDQLKDWQAGKTQVLVVQISTGAEGISLVRARYCIFYSVDYNLGTYEQFLARLRRPGQESDTVYYYHIIAKGTIDVEIHDALDDKRNINSAILDAISEDEHERSLVI